MIDDKEIIKEILPFNLTDNSNNNIKLIKRKLSIYNLQYNTNYSLEDLGIDIIYNKWDKNKYIFYFYKLLNGNFDSERLDIYKENYLKAYNFLKESIDGCEIFKYKDIPNSIYLFKKGEFILAQHFISKRFWLSYNLWSSLDIKFGIVNRYTWLEISIMSNNILEKIFEKNNYSTYLQNNTQKQSLEQAFRNKKYSKTIKI